ncbi:hypothetical protein [Sphingobacterium deserti]|uniref:Lipoprotein n=1 Tax=Sphingobacterium deserti TaxID=1229276 RepID=A0A0B8T5U0_9SPHI|nr:hypothetical protein [Sphingobacterium deserti]KGE12290.1 hypothetical protein DI53_3940 [Sphingobacterium deserti]
MNIKKIYQPTGMAFVLFAIVACSGSGESRNAGSRDGEASDTTSISNNGVPLDNIHRETTADTLTTDKTETTGVPMTNIDRTERNDTIGQPKMNEE